MGRLSVSRGCATPQAYVIAGSRFAGSVTPANEAVDGTIHTDWALSLVDTTMELHVTLQKAVQGTTAEVLGRIRDNHDVRKASPR